MQLSSKIIIVIAIIVAVAVIYTGYSLLNSGLAPLEQREDKTTNIATQNVAIKATTFNGDIVITESLSDQIEVTYNIEAPKGHISEIKTTTANQTLNENTEIVTEAKIENPNNQLKVNYRASITIKLPSTSQYNLTLNTLNGNIVKPQLNDMSLKATTYNGYIDFKDDNATSIEASSLNGNVKVSLVDGTLFQVDANTANGHVTYQGIAMSTSIQSSTHLKGTTTAGSGDLNLNLSTNNGNITIEYFSKST
jgi:DUF4097 and DUF4098 domain-containing protein YvlB